MEELVTRYPALNVCAEDIEKAYTILKDSYLQKGTLMVCGNGGSAADSDHIVGELMKGFLLPRTAPIKSLQGAKLQYGLPAISLVSQSALLSAVANDNGAEMVFAQQVLGYGNTGDVLLGLSTSGNSANIINAIQVAKELGITTIGMTGATGGRMKELCDCCICVPEQETYKVQEYHLPIYHALCSMLEMYFFG